MRYRRGVILAALALLAGPALAGEPPVFELAAIARPFRGYEGSLDDLAVSRDGTRVLTGDHERNVVLWDAAKGESLRVLSGHRAMVFAVAFSPDGRSALSGSGDGTLRVWDLGDGSLRREIPVQGDHVLTVEASADGRLALTGDESGGVKVWRLADGALLRDLGRHEAPVMSARFADGGRAVVTTDFDDRVRVYDLAKATATFEAHPVGFKPAVKGLVSPDGSLVAVVGETIEVRSIRTGARVASLAQAAVTGELGTRVAFSPDGRWLLAESARQRLNLWDLRTGALVRRFVPPNHARAFVFAPDGKTLLGVFGGAKTPLAWPVAPDPAQALRAAPAAAPPDPRRADREALGRLLLFDPRLSKDGKVSCATCHDPKKGWTDGRAVAIGIGGRKGKRNTMTLLNVGSRRPLLWDGRASTLEEQVHFPGDDPNEMASSLDDAARRLGAIAGYRPLFAKAFGDEGVTAERLARAIADFERTLVSLDSPYDRFAAGDAKALSEPARRGLALFTSKARCFVCHELERTDRQMFLNVGVPQGDGPADLGRGKFGATEDGARAFAVPDLHDLKYTPPYMHDGSIATLAEVVDFYDRGGGSDPGKSPWVLPLHLTPQEKADLVAFLESLSGDPLAQDPPAELPK